MMNMTLNNDATTSQESSFVTSRIYTILYILHILYPNVLRSLYSLHQFYILYLNINIVYGYSLEMDARTYRRPDIRTNF